MRNFYLSLLFLVFGVTVASAQCPITPTPSFTDYWTWPTHTNWFAGTNQQLDFGATGAGAPSIQTITGPGAPFPMYESVASASDENGNLVVFTNGVSLYDGAYNQITVPGGRLLTGAETAGGNTGSAVQGVLIVKHPLNLTDYYIFTTDDVISGVNGITNGFNYNIYDSNAGTCTAATRIGAFRSTEQVAATWHANGIDIWIVTHEATAGGSTTFNAYLLSCSGLNTTPVQSSLGFPVLQITANERGAIEFSADGTKAAATFHNGGGTWDPAGAVQLMDFDNATGMFSNSQKLAANNVAYSAPYDCEFSPSGNRLFVSNQCAATTEIGYYDLGAGNAYTAIGNTGDNRSGVMEKGGDGNIYMGNFRDFGCGAWQYGSNIASITAPDGGATYNQSAIAAGNQSVGWGMPNNFIPPRDWLEIQPVPALTECDMPYNLSTLWQCKGTDAENTPLYENAYTLLSGPGGSAVDAVTGVVSGGQGAYEVEFAICDIRDTITFNVGTCGCSADITNTPIEICAGGSVSLDPLVVSSSGTGLWSLDSIPSGAGSLPTIDAVAGDTTFNSLVGARPGTYKIMYTVDASCSDSVYITINAIPTPSITAMGPFCDYAAAEAMVGSPQHGADTTGVWKINGVVNGAGMFDPATEGAGTDSIRYIVTINGCTDSVDAAVVVNRKPVAAVNDSTVCAGISALFTATADSTINGYDWTIAGSQGTGTAATTSGTTAGTYSVEITDDNGCLDTASGTLTVNARPVAAVNDSTVCDGTSATFTATADKTMQSWNWVLPGSQGTGTAVSTSGTTAGDYIVEVTDTDGCLDTATGVLTVNPLRDATISDSLISACVFDPDPTVNVAEGGGTWSNPAVTMVGTTATIDLATLGAVTNEVITYTLPDPCGDVDQIVVTTTTALDATITPMATYCESDNTEYPLTAVDPGGTWFGTGVTDGGNGTGTFNPSTAGAGVHTDIEYRIPGNCGDTGTIAITVDAQPVATITGDQTLCENAAAVTLTADSTGGTWSQIVGGSGFNAGTQEFNPNVGGNGGTPYEIRHEVTNGTCSAADTAFITVIDTPEFTVNPIGPFCEGDAAVALSINPNDSTGGTWLINGMAPTTPGMFDPLTANLGPNVVTYTVGTCPVTQGIIADIYPTATASLPPDFSMCTADGDSTLAVIAADGTVNWNSSCGTCFDEATTTFDPELAGAGAGTATHTIILTVAAQCPAADTIEITVSRAADLTLDGPGPFCLGDFTDGEYPIDVQSDMAGSITDFTLDNTTGAAQIYDPSNAILTLNNGGGAGEFMFNVEYTTTDGCVSTDSVQVIVRARPIVSFQRSNEDSCVAYDETFVDISDYSLEPTATLSSSVWDFGNGLTSTDTGQVNTSYTAAGTYSVTLNNVYSNGCTGSATMEVEAYPIPVADFEWSPNPASILDPRINFTDLSTVESGFIDSLNWEFGAQGSPTSSYGYDASPAVVYTVEGDDTIPVVLHVVTDQGCTDSIVRPVIIQDIFQVYVPNAFTPGNRPDGLNDTFYPQGRNWADDNYEFVVLDRWGNLIFETTTIGKGWDGTVDGSLSSGRVAQIDVYVWKLKVKDRYSGDVHKMVGTVTLVR